MACLRQVPRLDSVQVGRPPLGLLLHCLLAVAPAGEDAPRTGHWKQCVWLV